MYRNRYAPPLANVVDIEPEHTEYVGFWLRSLAALIDALLLLGPRR